MSTMQRSLASRVLMVTDDHLLPHVHVKWNDGRECTVDIDTLETLPRLVEGARPMSNQRFASVCDAIEDTPEEAENMQLRSVLMKALKNHLTRTEMSQAQAAKLLGVTQPRVSDLMRGKINLFGLDALVNMATAAGLHIEMRVFEAA
jgi:predicted XRE-type DNA-binding protein